MNRSNERCNFPTRIFIISSIFIIIAVCFALGRYYERVRTVENAASELNANISSLRNDLLMMNVVITRRQRNNLQGSKDDFISIPSISANVYTRMQILTMRSNLIVKHEKELSVSRPSVQYILAISHRALSAEYEEYPQLFDDASILENCCIGATLWNTLSSLDDLLSKR
jgi:uncharacterized protein (UPF0333 family)